MEEEEYDFLFKVAFVGESGVGKTSLIRRFLHNEFEATHKPTIGVEFASRNIVKNNLRVKLQVWDLAGQERYKSVTSAYVNQKRCNQQYYRGSVCIVLVFDITRAATFHKLTKWLQEVREHVDRNVELYLVANKMDAPIALHEVSLAEAKHFAAENNLQFIATSALTAENVLLLFEDMAVLGARNRASLMSMTDESDTERPQSSSYSSPISLTTDMSSGAQGSKIDNVFGDLENLFGCLGSCMYCCTCSGVTRGMSLPVRAAVFLPRAITRLVLLCALVVLLVAVILPSFFTLLLLRTRTVEDDTKDFTMRQEVMKREGLGRKLLRWLSLLGRSIPMTFFLVGLPVVLIYYVIPHYANNNNNNSSNNLSHTSGVVLGSIGAHLILLVLLQILGTIRNAKAVEVKEKSKKPQRQQVVFRWKNFRNWVAIVTLVIDLVQMCAWPLQQFSKSATRSPDSSPSPDTSIVDDDETGFLDYLTRHVFPALFLTISSHLYDFSFYFAVGVVCALLVCFAAQLMIDVSTFAEKKGNDEDEANNYFFYSFIGTVVYGHGRLQKVSNRLCGLIALFADTLFMTVCNKLLTLLSCSYETSSSAPMGHLLADPTVRCWEGEHAMRATIALIAFSYYIPLAVMVSPMFMEASQENKDIKYVETYIMTVSVSKCIMLLVSTFFSQSALAMVVASAVVCVLLLLCTIIWISSSYPALTKPASLPSVNVFKCFVYACAVVTSLCAVISNQYPETFPKSTQFIVILIGLVLNSGVFGAWYYRIRNSHNYSAVTAAVDQLHKENTNDEEEDMEDDRIELDPLK